MVTVARMRPPFIYATTQSACIEAPIDLNSLPLLGMAYVIDSHVVMLTPSQPDVAIDLIIWLNLTNQPKLVLR